MFTRISSLVAASVIALSACAPESGAPEGESVDCALGVGAEFAADCGLERAEGGSVVIHHPDGAFVRVTFDADSGLLSVNDGALQLDQTTKASEDPVEFSTGAVRYRVSRDLLTQTGS